MTPSCACLPASRCQGVTQHRETLKVTFYDRVVFSRSVRPQERTRPRAKPKRLARLWPPRPLPGAKQAISMVPATACYSTIWEALTVHRKTNNYDMSQSHVVSLAVTRADVYDGLAVQMFSNVQFASKQCPCWLCCGCRPP